MSNHLYIFIVVTWAKVVCLKFSPDAQELSSPRTKGGHFRYTISASTSSRLIVHSSAVPVWPVQAYLLDLFNIVSERFNL